MSEKQKPSGALWKRTNQFGDFFSGQLEMDGKKIGFRCYLNAFKTTEKHPDYRIFLNTKQEETPKGPERTLPAKKWTPPAEVMDNDDVPF
jgi:hypothetical protein